MAGLPDRITEVLEVINSKDGMASKHYFERMNATLRADYPAYEFWSNPAQNLQSLVQALACSDEQLQMCVDKLENKFKKRDFLLFWLDLAIDRDDPDRIDQILHEQLEPDFQHLGYRKKLRFHLNRKDIEGFLASFKHIKKRERILPETLNTIEAMVELVSAKMGTEEAKNFLLRKKVISAAEVGLYTPAL